MDSVLGYGAASSDDDEDTTEAPGLSVPTMSTALAPHVDVTASTEFREHVDPTQKQLATNPTYEAMGAAEMGPKNPHQRGRLNRNHMNLSNGNLEKAGIQAYDFEEQYHTFDNCGFAANPSAFGDQESRAIVGAPHHTARPATLTFRPCAHSFPWGIAV
jgi:hypothetical protein